jgi:hypothetical protein
MTVSVTDMTRKSHSYSPEVRLTELILFNKLFYKTNYLFHNPYFALARVIVYSDLILQPPIGIYQSDRQLGTA